MTATHLLFENWSELFAEASTTGKITLAVRLGMQATLLNESLDEEDQQAIDRMLYALRKGRVCIES